MEFGEDYGPALAKNAYEYGYAFEIVSYEFALIVDMEVEFVRSKRTPF